MLLDKEYLSKIKECIQETVDFNKDANPNTLWEITKGSIRNTTIKYAAHRKLLLKMKKKAYLSK